MEFLLKVSTYILVAFSWLVDRFALIWDKAAAFWQFAKELNREDSSKQPRDKSGRHGRYHGDA
ncbi:MAG: hypothetical protein ACI9SY_000162 [Candidatus Paceibacteria bacterium]|jgi:hypothetical protein